MTKATLTATAADATKVYGDANPALSTNVTGFINGDTAGTALGLTASTANSTATALTSVGTSAITVTAGTANNYNITPVAGVLTTNAATLTVTANNATKVYGAATPALSNTITGFKNGQDASVVTGSATPTSATSATTGVGTSVIVSTPGTLASGNYTFSYTNGTLTINPATLTVTTNASTKVYGDALPTFSSTVVGLVNSDTTSAATYSTLGTASSNVGNYAVTATLTPSANYTVQYVAGQLTVTPATLTVTANNATKLTGTVNPTFTGVITGFVNNDTLATATTNPAVYATEANTASPVGNFAITSSLTATPNYTVVDVDGTLAVTADTKVATPGSSSSANGKATYRPEVFMTPPNVGSLKLIGDGVKLPEQLQGDFTLAIKDLNDLKK